MFAKISVILHIMLGASLVGALATGAAEKGGGLLFHADFDHGFDASFSKGDSKTEVRGAALVAGRRGAALVVRGERSYCRFKVAGNLSPESGTVMMWVSPVAWDASDDKFRHFFGAGDPKGGTMGLYRFCSVGNLVWLVGSAKLQRWGIAEFPISNWKSGQWRHIAATWERGRFGDGETALYMDGWKVANGVIDRDVHPTTLGDDFSLGTAGSGPYDDPTRGTAIDDVYIYDHALSPFEIQRAFEEQGGDLSTLFPVPKVDHSPMRKSENAFVLRTVPKPWTPLRLQSPKATGPKLQIPHPQSQIKNRKSQIVVDCWGREYRLSFSGLPDQITSAGAALLARPVTLKAVVNGKPAAWVTCGTSILSTSQTDATFASRQQSGNLVIRTVSKIEFDGMQRLDLELRSVRANTTPQYPSDARLEQLWLEVPFRSERARYLYACADNFWDTWAGALPASGWKNAFYPFVWLGDEDRGLCWFAESDAGWSLTDKREGIVVTRRPSEVLLRINFINSPLSLHEPLRLTFGLQATPVKPFPRGWRKWRMTDASANRGGPGNLGIIWSGNPYTKWFGYPEAADEAKLKQRISDLHEAGRLALPYWNVGFVSTGVPAFRDYGTWWCKLTGCNFISSDVQAQGYPILGVCPKAPGWVDHILGRIGEAMDRYGTDGFYQDGFQMVACDNVRHGCGKRGTSQPPPLQTTPYYPIFATREMFKRASVLVKSKKQNGMIIGHMSGCLQIPILSFADAYLDGEHITSSWYRLNGAMVSGDYWKRLPLDAFRTEFMGRQWGIVPFFLPEFYGEAQDKPEPTRHLMALLMLHDVNPWDIHCHAETVHRCWQALDRFGVADAEFLGYWRRDPPVRASPPLLISLYRKAHSVLMVLANLASAATEGQIMIDWRRLNIGQPTELRGALTGDTMAVTDGEVKVRVEAESFRLLVAGKY